MTEANGKCQKGKAWRFHPPPPFFFFFFFFGEGTKTRTQISLKSVESRQIFQSADFARLFCQCLCYWGTVCLFACLLACFDFELHEGQPRCFALSQWRAEKVGSWVTVYSRHTLKPSKGGVSCWKERGMEGRVREKRPYKSGSLMATYECCVLYADVFPAT